MAKHPLIFLHKFLFLLLESFLSLLFDSGLSPKDGIVCDIRLGEEVPSTVYVVDFC